MVAGGRVRILRCGCADHGSAQSAATSNQVMANLVNEVIDDREANLVSK
jgi:hypothetical protein